MKAKDHKENLITWDTSNPVLDDPNNYISDELFDYLIQNELDFKKDDQDKDLKYEEEYEINLKNYVPQIVNSSQDEEDFDVYEYFAIYNDVYFNGKLGCVRLEWSKRMTTCAGIFYTKLTEYIIRLSEPLLKFRSIKEIKETLLHEMIHAWVQIENLDQSDDRSGHGYNFKSKMYEINKSTGFNITVYHNFHDEVDYHKKHVWRCCGVCRTKAPYYGYVKRAMNRAPGKNDFWWDEHKNNCGGDFIKIQEPEKILKNNTKADGKNKLTREQNNINLNNFQFDIKNVIEKVQVVSNTIKTKKNKKIEDFFKLNKKN
jgi:hypothetical protein